MTNRYDELQLGPVHLRPDGTIVVGDQEMPQSAAIDFPTDGNARLFKDSGEGQPLTLTDTSGQTVTLAFKGNAWYSDSDLSAHAARPSNAQRSQQQRDSVSGARPNASAVLRKLLPWVAAIGLAAVAIVAAVYLLEPLRRLDPFVTGKKTTTEPDKPPDPVVVSANRLLYQDAKVKLTSLENDTASFRSRFQAAVGQTIDYAATHPAERPREVDFAVLESKPFDRAYTQVLDSRPSLEDVRARKDILAAIETRLRDALSGDEDKRIIDELVQWMKDRRAALDGHGGNLTLLETTLKKYRNDPRLSGP